MFLTKLSLLLLYKRLFSPSRLANYLVIFGALYNFVLYTTYICLTFLLCNPTTLSRHCIRELNIFIFVASGLNVLGDLYELLIPVLIVSGLQLALRQKLRVLVVFFAGTL